MAVNLPAAGEFARRPSILNRAWNQLFGQSGYAADGSDFAGFSKLGVYYPRDMTQLTVNASTPSVANNDKFYTANTAATIITGFSFGHDGQEITVFVGDANTTLRNSASLSLTTPGDQVLTTPSTVRFLNRGGVWYQSTAVTTAPFKPTNIQGLALWLAADQITGLADNTSMPSWPDLSNTGTAVTQSNATYQPKYRLINGVPFVRNTLNGGFQIDFATPIAPDEGTTFIVGQNPTVSQSHQTIFHLGPYTGGGLAQTTYQLVQNLGQIDMIRNDHWLAGQVMPSTWGIIAFAGSASGAGLPEGSGAWMYLNGQKAFRQKGSNANGWTTLAPGTVGFMGALGAGQSFYWTGDWRCVLHYTRRLTDTEIQRVLSYLSATYGVSLVAPFTRNLVFDGDSLTVGYTGTGDSVASAFTDQILKQLPVTVKSYNVAVVGQTIAQMTADAATQVNPLVDAAVLKNTLVVWAGTNDIAATPGAPNTHYNNLVAYCTARRTAGYKVAVLTCLPRGAVAQFETDRQAFNTLIRNNWATFADALVDVGNDATIGVAGAQNNVTYYQGDATHLNTAGWQIAANLAVTGINSI